MKSVIFVSGFESYLVLIFGLISTLISIENKKPKKNIAETTKKIYSKSNLSKKNQVTKD